MDWRVEDKTLLLETGKRITFDFPIKGVNEHSENFDIRLVLSQASIDG